MLHATFQPQQLISEKRGAEQMDLLEHFDGDARECEAGLAVLKAALEQE
jgi:hypothetical protein